MSVRLGVFVTALLSTSPLTAAGPDPLQVAPSQYQTLIDNGYVRVLRHELEPGAAEPMHWHPRRVTINLAPAETQVTLQDGTSTSRTLVPGDVKWREAETHAIANVGRTREHNIIVELKEQDPPPDSAAMVLKLDQERQTAYEHADRQAIERLVAPDATLGHSDGHLEDRDDLLKQLASGERQYQSLKNSDVDVRVHGHTATITGITTVTFTQHGRTETRFNRFLRVYAWFEGSWHLVANQSAKLEGLRPDA
jgi:beta-alanine degradation protein BauB